MDKEFLEHKLQDMRAKYIGSVMDKVEERQQDPKKLQKLKKKLVSLEMERCHKQMEHQDCSKINEKILEQKSLFERMCKQGQ